MSFAFVSTISMLVVLGVLVLVHEFGHFAVAKLFGVRVETFSIGFGKRLFGFRRGDTDYRISLLPLGGYVKMAGELGGDGKIPVSSGSAADTAPRDPGDLNSKTRWQRILIACAGPAANFLLAILLMTAVYIGQNEVHNYLSDPAVIDYVVPNSVAAKTGLQHGDRIVRFDTVENPTWDQVLERSVLNLNHSVRIVVQQPDGAQKETSLFLKSPANPDDFSLGDVGLTPEIQKAPLRVAMVEAGMPGAKAGLESGDEIVSIDGIHLHSLPSMVLYLQQNGNKPVTLSILRNGTPTTVTVTPHKAVGSDGQPRYQIGFNTDPPPSHIERLSLPQAFSKAVKECVNESTMLMDVLRRVVTHRMSARTLSGPVGIARQTGYVVSMPGWSPMMAWTAFISVQLGILNLLPIPILDGGMILFLLIESVMRRDMNETLKERVYQTAFVFFILLMVFVLFNDLSKIPSIARLKL
ncbi:MAG TPA: RIP metalloprotease RseP [Acidobacteriaceae bacterium]|nr:RIP metalloprotease RseP [Acidobacteriaceae bacterium]